MITNCPQPASSPPSEAVEKAGLPSSGESPNTPLATNLFSATNEKAKKQQKFDWHKHALAQFSDTVSDNMLR